MSLTNNPGSDKRELIQSFTKALCEPAPMTMMIGKCQYDDADDVDDNDDDVDDNNSRSFQSCRGWII